MSTERRYFSSRVRQTHPRDPRTGPGIKIPRGADTRISFRFCKVFGHSWIEAPDATVFDAPKFEAKRVITVLLSAVRKSSKRRYYTKIIVENLSSIGVPLHEQDTIIESVFNLAEVAIPGMPILVWVGEVTVCLLDSASNLGIGDVTCPLWCNGRYVDDRQGMYQRLEMEAMYSDVPKLIPATESSIEGLEKVRLDNLEDAVRQMPCTICMEGLDHFDAAEEGTDHQHMIACLPCSHTYHGDCIIQWLKTNYVCPLCRSPIVEGGEPSKPPLRLHWPMLMMSAVGMLTATLIPRLLNRS
ncbi:uncharacterized protein LOC133743937 [Rosa rugosa]|uniref:uncharacterized protein LOC133743937 n=1 Tax=Rosa rugosa TaxID=74645 RepID=UPI002B4150BB|nr:uncharacterized protein LOC133743937 [Rosa rugosa]